MASQCGGVPGLNPEGEVCGTGTLPEGLTFPPFVLHAGEEEDGDDDDEAEGATGKRAAEDDEVGKVGSPSEPYISPEGLGAGRVSVELEGPGLTLGLECFTCVLPMSLQGHSPVLFIHWPG